MKLRFFDKKTDEIRIEIDDLTFCEVLRKELWEDKAVVNASYSRKHPTKNPILQVQTEGKNVKKVLQDAVKRLEKKNEELVKTFKAAVR